MVSEIEFHLVKMRREYLTNQTPFLMLALPQNLHLCISNASPPMESNGKVVGGGGGSGF